jgi:osmotically-inducible protein OsmY
VSEENVSANDIKVITENGEVFLMGLVTEKEANLAADVARHVSGVEKVIKVFEYL